MSMAYFLLLSFINCPCEARISPGIALSQERPCMKGAIFLFKTNLFFMKHF